MPWNGSKFVRPDSKPDARKAPPPSRRFPWRGIAAGLLVVAGTLAAWHFIGGSGEDAPKPAKTASRAKKPRTKPAEPKVVPTNAAPAAVEEKAVRRTAKGTIIPDRVQPDKNGVLRYPGGLRWVDTNNLDIVRHPEPKRLFAHHSENSIAQILTLDPNKMCPYLVGHRPKFGQRFVDDFKASLNEPENYPETDSEEDREVRRMVYETKKEMAAALRRGEDIAKMMNDAQDELDQMVRYKDTFVKQLREIRDDEKYTDADVEDFMKAANALLKSKGLKELANPKLTLRQARLARIREMKANQEQQGTGK